MAGRTDSAIALEVLTLAGLPEPRRLVGAFQKVLAAHAPELAQTVREQARALPGAAAALAALARLNEPGASPAGNAPADDAPAGDAPAGQDPAGDGTTADASAGAGRGPGWSSHC